MTTSSIFKFYPLTHDTHPHTTTHTYTIRVSLCAAREARTNIMVPGNRTYNY